MNWRRFLFIDSFSTVLGICIGTISLIVAMGAAPEFQSLVEGTQGEAILSAANAALENDTPRQGVERFLDWKSFMIVMGGLLSSILIAFSGKRILRCVLVFTFLSKVPPLREWVNLRESYIPQSELNRQLEQLYRTSIEMIRRVSKGEPIDHQVESIQHGQLSSWVKKYIMSNTGTEAEIKTVIQKEIRAIAQEAEEDQKLLVFCAQASPAFGMVGTVIGLVLLMSQAQGRNISEIIAAMSLALVTTLYGVLLANLVFYPLKSKREQFFDAHRRLYNLMQDSILLMKRKALPSMAKDELSSHLPEHLRSKVQREK